MKHSILDRLVPVFILLLLLPVSAWSQPTSLQDFEAFAEEARKVWKVPGVAIAVVKDDQLIFSKGFGLLSADKEDKVDENTIFAIGSNTKLFTSTAIGMLIQEKKLTWDDRIIQYLPYLELYDPYTTYELTLRDAMSHRSGIPTWAGDLVAWGSRYNRKELLQKARYLKPEFPFRSGYGYCNLMFVAAGEVIPVVSGKSWDDFIKEKFFQPLKMSRSSTTISKLPSLSNVAQPHTTFEGKIVQVPYRNIDNMGPAGSINSTVSDMAQWLRFQLNHGTFEGKNLVEETILDEIQSPQNPLRVGKAAKELFPSRHFSSYGLGVGISDYYGRILYMHGGGIDGMISRVAFVPEEKLGIVILTNHDDHNLDAALFYTLIDILLKQPGKGWNDILMKRVLEQKKKEQESLVEIEKARVQGTKPAMSIDRYAATYHNDHYGNITISHKSSALSLNLDAHPGIHCDLKHWHYETFLCDWNDVEFGKSYVNFTVDSSAEVSEVSFKVREDFVDPLEYRFNRVPPETEKK